MRAVVGTAGLHVGSWKYATRATVFVGSLGLGEVIWLLVGPSVPELAMAQRLVSALVLGAPLGFLGAVAWALARAAKQGRFCDLRVGCVMAGVSFWLGLSALTTGLFAVGSGLPEGVYPLDPLVDTRFAPGYSRDAFGEVVPGMTERQVLEMLGDPLTKSADGSVWNYTLDGKCTWGDFAWLTQSVEYDSGTVSRTITRWNSD